MKKQIFIVLIVIFCVILLSGCTGDNSDESEDENGTSDNESNSAQADMMKLVGKWEVIESENNYQFIGNTYFFNSDGTWGWNVTGGESGQSEFLYSIEDSQICVNNVCGDFEFFNNYKNLLWDYFGADSLTLKKLS